MADPVELSLLMFDGTDEASQAVRRAVLRFARDLPYDDPIRERIDIFLGNVAFGVTAVMFGATPAQWIAVMQKDWRPLAEAIARGYWLN